MSAEHGGHGVDENRVAASLRDNLEAAAAVTDEMIGVFIFGLFGALGMGGNYRKTGRAAAPAHH